MPFILTEGVTLSWVRDDLARLSVFYMQNATGDEKLTRVSGRRGRLVEERPCCVTRLVTEHKFRAAAVLMCDNRPRQLVGTDIQ